MKSVARMGDACEEPKRLDPGMSLRPELRCLLEESVEPLPLYGRLLRRLEALDPGSLGARMRDPVTHDLRRSVQALWPDPASPCLSLATRSALLTLLTQTAPEEEELLAIALLEHLSLHLEPYLQAALADSDQARYLRPLLELHGLDDRPVERLLALRRSAMPGMLPRTSTAVASRSRSAGSVGA